MSFNPAESTHLVAAGTTINILYLPRGDNYKFPFKAGTGQLTAFNTEHWTQRISISGGFNLYCWGRLRLGSLSRCSVILKCEGTRIIFVAWRILNCHCPASNYTPLLTSCSSPFSRREPSTAGYRRLVYRRSRFHIAWRRARQTSSEMQSRTNETRWRNNSLNQARPIVHELFLSLEEFAIGCTKRMKIATKVCVDGVHPVATVERTEEQIVSVEVPAGAKDGTRLVVPFAGNKEPGIIPGDVIFVIREREHALFRRDDENNLIYKARISLQEALTGCDILIQLPCGETLNLGTTDVISHGTCKKIPGKGMPRDGGNRGDLFVLFSVIFPVNLTEEQKCAISSILSD